VGAKSSSALRAGWSGGVLRAAVTGPSEAFDAISDSAPDSAESSTRGFENGPEHLGFPPVLLAARAFGVAVIRVSGADDLVMEAIQRLVHRRALLRELLQAFRE